MQGYLVKQGAIVRNWKRRFFTAASVDGAAKLRYFEGSRGPHCRPVHQQARAHRATAQTTKPACPRARSCCRTHK
jgi:hypothetical protein